MDSSKKIKNVQHLYDLPNQFEMYRLKINLQLQNEVIINGGIIMKIDVGLSQTLFDEPIT